MKTEKFYENLLGQTHLLIAGATGSGKSVVINGMIATALNGSPADVQFVLIDPKRVELVDYRDLPHTIAYATDAFETLTALRMTVRIIEARFTEMQKRRIKKYDGSDIYVVIDELADLMTTMKKQASPLLQRIAQIGRAAKVHLVAATQCPLASVIDTSIKCNIDARVALRTRSAQDSRNIIGQAGCEKLPRYGKAIYMNPDDPELDVVDVPMFDEAARIARVKFWEANKAQRVWFSTRTGKRARAI
jgi:S-DNA-T family DNA segregation ATPase FtsK/SpoIIIE